MPEPTDFNDPFSHFDPEVPMPLSAADVRRRGDRLRRRNTGLAIAGGVAVIALIAAPIAVLSGDDDTNALPPATTPTSAVDSNPPPSTEPAPTDLVTTIPDGFPLAAGLPEVNPEDGTPTEVIRGAQTTDFRLCENSPVALQEMTDLAQVEYSAPEDYRGRILVVFQSTDAASAALSSARETLGSCGAEGVAYAEEASPYDEDSAVFSIQYPLIDAATGESFGLATGLGIIEAVRVENALYLARYDNEGGGSDDAVVAGVERSAEQSAVAVSAVQAVFGGGDPDTAPTSAPALLSPADLPDRGRLGSWAEDPDDTITWACGPAGLFTDLEAQTSAAVRYAASGSDDEGGPAIARVRTAVLQFSPDGDAAERAYDQLQDNLASCADDDDTIKPLKAGGYVQGLGDDATWSGFSYAAAEICTECDAFWFDRMGVARVGDRVVVVSYAEVGGPLQPRGLSQALLDVFERAVELA